MVVRVTGIDTGTLGAAEWRIEAMEDVFGMSNTVLSPPPPHVESRPSNLCRPPWCWPSRCRIGNWPGACRVQIWPT